MQAFVEKLRLNYGTELILAKLAEYGIPNKLAFQIQDQYKEKHFRLLKKIPINWSKMSRGSALPLPIGLRKI